MGISEKNTRNDDAWRAVALKTAAHRNRCDERHEQAGNYTFATIDGRKFATATMRKSSAHDGVSNAHTTSNFGPLAPMYNVGECARESALRNLRVSYDPPFELFPSHNIEHWGPGVQPRGCMCG